MTVPWFIGSNGAKHPPEVARGFIHALAGNTEGVVSPADMKVSALAVPGPAVQISPGGVILLNRSPGGERQSYMDAEIDSVQLNIAPTGSGGGRSDLVVRRVEDPDYPPWQIPADPVNGPYAKYAVIPGVPNTTKTAMELNLGYPAVELARIDIPVSTATIQAAHIVSLRKLARPHRERRVVMKQPVAQDLVSAAQVFWPTAPIGYVDVPIWATDFQIIAHIAGVSRVTGNAQGYIWCWIGGNPGQGGGPADGYATPIGYDVTGGTDSTRDTLLVSSNGKLWAGSGGLTMPLQLSGRRDSGTGALRLGTYTTIIFDIEFTEKI